MLQLFVQTVDIVRTLAERSVAQRSQLVELRELVEKQQTQIKLLQESNRNLSMRLNKLDRQNRENHQALW